MLLFLICFIFLVLYYVYYVLTKNHDYWKKRNVPFLTPKLLFGNYREYIFQKEYAPEVASDICKQFPKEPYIGVFYGTEPALLVQDPDIIKLILVKDFYNFNGREITNYIHREVLTNTITLSGGDVWKVLRLNLSPFFTSSKIKNMFPLINSCARELGDLLQTETKLSSNINVRSLLAKYTMECIVSCAFGINANAMKSVTKENPFMIMGEKVFDTSIERGLKMVCRSMWPAQFYGLGFKMFDERIYYYFNKIFTEVSENRRNNRSVRNDFVDIFMEWKKKSYITCDSINYSKTEKKKTFKMEVNDEVIVAASIALFGAGFESTATTMTFLLYELAKNKPAQDRVIDEVDMYLKKHSGVIDYECVNEMPYLEACIEETLRLYPVLGVITRDVMNDYTLPTGLHLKPGDRIHIPVHHIHRDSYNFPEPEVFHPERFLEDERKKIKPFTFLPFGEGPRTCLGLRFSKMPIHAGMLTIFKNYSVVLADNTPTKLQFKPTAFAIQSVKDIHLDLVSR